MILKPKNLPKIQNDLSSILTQFLEALQTDDAFPKMEHNFFLKTKNALNVLKKNNFKLSVSKLPEENQKHNESFQILETNHYLGNCSKFI